LDKPRQLDEWVVLKLGSVTWGDYDETQHKTLPPDVPAFPSSEVHIGDVLVSRKNTYELVGASAYVWRTGGRVLLPDLIFRLNIADSGVLNPMYLWALMGTESKRRQLRGLASGAAASMPNISKARLASLPLEVPPIQRQRHFAALVIDAHDLGSQQLRASAAAAQTFQSLLAGAFSVGCAT
jgi:type I restriction enzyme S subunit